MSERPADKKMRLRHILESEAAVSSTVADYLIDNADGPLLESPADLAKLWDADSARASAVTDVLEKLQPAVDKDTFAGKRLLGRLLAAYDYAVQDHQGEAKQLSEPEKPAASESDGLWPDQRASACATEVSQLCGGLVLGPEQIPCSPIMARMDRLWRERKQELIQLANMKTAADYALLIKEMPKEEQIAQVGSAASLFLRQGVEMYPDAPVVTTEQVLEAISIMSSGWLLLGTKQIPIQGAPHEGRCAG